MIKVSEYLRNNKIGVLPDTMMTPTEEVRQDTGVSQEIQPQSNQESDEELKKSMSTKCLVSPAPSNGSLWSIIRSKLQMYRIRLGTLPRDGR